MLRRERHRASERSACLVDAEKLRLTRLVGLRLDDGAFFDLGIIPARDGVLQGELIGSVALLGDGAFLRVYEKAEPVVCEIGLGLAV